MKTAGVTPNHNQIENYRPVSVRSTLSKVFEKIVNTRLTSFFKANNSINRLQYGFWKKTNTQSATIDVTNMINQRRNDDKKKQLAFSWICRKNLILSITKLLTKLHSMGVRGKANLLIESYLSLTGSS